MLGEVQQQSEGPPGSARQGGEAFEGWQARKQLQRKVEGLQARLKVWWSGPGRTCPAEFQQLAQGHQLLHSGCENAVMDTTATVRLLSSCLACAVWLAGSAAVSSAASRLLSRCYQKIVLL